MPLAALSQFFGLKNRRQTGWVGIDIGSHSIKVAQLQLFQGQKQIIEAASYPVPVGATLTASSIRAGWLTDALRQLVSQIRGFRGATAACALSPSATEFRSLNIPPGTDSERRDMLAQELAQDPSYQGQPFHFDFWAVESNSSDSAGQHTVNLITIPISLIHAVVEAITQAGLYCRTMDGGPFVLARAATMSAPAEDTVRPIGVLNWGHSESQFIVALRGRPVFTRVLKGCNAHQLTAAVSRGLQLSELESHEVLRQYGIAEPITGIEATSLQEHLTEITTPVIRELKVELHKTLTYLKQQKPRLLPHWICLMGGATGICDISSRLSSEFLLPVETWQFANNGSAGGTKLVGNQPLGSLGQAAALSDLGWAA